MLTGCSAGAGRVTDTACPGDRVSTLTVLAASSTGRALAETEPAFLGANPCVSDVVVSLGSSATLAAQVVNGAPAQVFVSASRSTMDMVVGSGRAVGEPVVFARNEAAIMVSTGSDVAASVDRIADLADAPGRRVRAGLCVATAPCGALADRVLDHAGLDRGAVVDTEATSVEDLVTKIDVGELDAGIVYRSDCAVARRSVRCVTIPPEQNATTEYLVVALEDSAAVRAWLTHMSSDGFRRTLTDSYGFLAP